MSDVSSAPRPEAVQKNLAARLIGVIFSPGQTFRSIVAHPTWLGAMLAVVIVVAGGNFAASPAIAKASRFRTRRPSLLPR